MFKVEDAREVESDYIDSRLKVIVEVAARTGLAKGCFVVGANARRPVEWYETQIIKRGFFNVHVEDYDESVDPSKCVSFEWDDPDHIEKVFIVNPGTREAARRTLESAPPEIHSILDSMEVGFNYRTMYYGEWERIK